VSAGFPPRRKLAQVLRSLAKHLPAHVAPLLEHARFSEDAAALRRFADAAHLNAATDALDPGEAAWLAELLLERWSLVAEPILEPEVAVVAPDEVWVGNEPVDVVLSLETFGIEPGWEAVWEGDLAPGPPAPTAILIATAPRGNEPLVLRARAHVRARSAGQRTLLVAATSVRVRRPVVVVSEDRRRILVTDQEERPAPGVRVSIGEQMHTANAAGLVLLTDPAPRGARLAVEGIAAHRIPE
jgi:hypothetical protein